MAETLAQPPKLQRYFERAIKLSFKKGDIIVRPDDIPGGLHMIESGFVKVYSITPSGDENLHLIYKAGELFPLIWAVTGRIQDVFYEAIAPVVVRRLPRDEFKQLIETDIEVANVFMMQIVEQFSLYTERVNNLEYINAYQRVAYRLLILARRFGIEQSGRVTIEIPLTHQNIASSIRLSRETASREIEKLIQKGYITYEKRRFVINDVIALEAQVGGLISDADHFMESVGPSDTVSA